VLARRKYSKKTIVESMSILLFFQGIGNEQGTSKVGVYYAGKALQWRLMVNDVEGIDF
jgi:hypothetical protein